MSRIDCRTIAANVFAETAAKAMEHEFVVIRPADIRYERGSEGVRHDDIVSAAKRLGCAALVELVVSPCSHIGYHSDPPADRSYNQSLQFFGGGDRHWTTVHLMTTMTRLRNGKPIWRTSARVEGQNYDTYRSTPDDADLAGDAAAELPNTVKAAVTAVIVELAQR